jgi:long-chain fatty acid transport protein
MVGALLLVALGSTSGWSAGYVQSNQGARARALGNAVTALADDASALYFNPAGLVQLPGLALQANVAFSLTRYRYDSTPVPGTTSETAVSSDLLLQTLPSFFAAYRVHPRGAVGIGVYSPYASSVRWPQIVSVNGTAMGWWGRDQVQELHLRSIVVSPTVAVMLHPRVLFGAGLNLAKGSLSLRHAISASDDPRDDLQAQLELDDFVFGASAGLLINAVPKLLTIGLAYRSSLPFRFEGTRVYRKQGSSAGIASELRSEFHDGPIQVTVPMPHTLCFGLGADPFAGVRIGFTLEVNTWSAIETLAWESLDRANLGSTEYKNWRNTIAARLGVEFAPRQDLALRAGFVFDQSPVPRDTVGPDLPDASRYELTLGAGYWVRGFRFDLAYIATLAAGGETSTRAPLLGHYGVDSHSVMLGVSFERELK